MEIAAPLSGYIRSVRLYFLRHPGRAIMLVCLMLFVPGLGAVHLFDWDEINFAEIAREMITTGDYLRPHIDYLPFFEKPPLFIWLQVLSMKLFGVNEFAARLPNAICGMLTLLVLYHIGLGLRNRAFGILWALTYVGSILPHLYFRSGIIDPWFNLFIFLGLHAFILLAAGKEGRTPGALNTEKVRHARLAGTFIGLAILTKGPVGLLVPALCALVYWARGRFAKYVSRRGVLLALAVMACVSALWFAADLVINGPSFLSGFIVRQVTMLTTEDAGHGGFTGYHFVVLLAGCFPASWFALAELFKPTRRDDAVNDYRRWMVILFWVVLVLFSLVKTKIVHYSSLAYFPLTFLAALRLERSWRRGIDPGWPRYAVMVAGILIGSAVVVLPFIGMHPGLVAPLFAADPFAQANLQADVHWTGFEMVAGLWLIGVLLLSHRLFQRGSVRAGILGLFGGCALFVTITLYFFIGRIEGYSQRAAIEFFMERQGEKCYVITKDYKSYAQLFYSRKPPVTEPRAHDEDWLLYNKVDRPVYVVCKVTSADEVAHISTLHELYRKNGFVFFKRDPPAGRSR